MNHQAHRPAPPRRSAPAAGLLLLLFLPVAAPPALADSGFCAGGPTTVNDAAAGCNIVTPPILGGAITVNGTEGAGEWTGAQVKPLTGDFTGTVSLFRSTDDLYLLIEADDNSFNAADQIRVFFDPLHNHGTTADDFEFRIKRNSNPDPAVANHRKISGGGDVQWDPADEGSELGITGAAVASAQWTVELKLTPGELGLADLPPILGFGVQAESNPAGDLATWPSIFDAGNPAGSWANLKTRFPVDYLIVLDQSGSMLSQNKWTNAKNAANYLANAMAVFRAPGHFQDRVGVVTFAWLCSGGDQTTTALPLAQVAASPGDYTSDLIDPIGNNCTPIGQGLAEAFNAMNLDATQATNAAETQRGVLLLSDGLQNRPGPTFTPASTGYQACSNSFNDACAVSNVQVDTVAFGDGDWAVDTDLLSDIKNHYAGQIGSTYNLATNVEDLKQSFLSALEDFFRLNLLSAGPLNNFTVNAGEHRLAVILSWTNPAQAQAIKLRRAGVDQPATCQTDTAVGFATCVVETPAAGVNNWAAVRMDGMAFAPNPDRQFVLVDLKLRARFAVDRAVHGTGQDLVLTAELRDGGRPVLHDPAAGHPVDARVVIERPDEGVGTFATVHEPEDCRVIEPRLPPFGGAPGQGGPFVRGTVVGGPGAGAPPAATAPAAGDPLSTRFAAVAQLLRACGRDGLPRSADPGLALLDDGTQGDEVAGDGVYTLRYSDSRTEGSYVFHFRVEGTTADGEAFTRAKTFAEFVRVQVDQGATLFDSRVVSQVGNLVVREYFVLPRDRFGGYLGLGRDDEIDFVASGGAWVSPVLDYGNGFYSRLLQFDRTAGEPEVTPVVQGRPFTAPSRRGKLEAVVPFVGFTLFDGALGLDDGPVIGSRLGFLLRPRLAFELEGGLTSTDTRGGDSARVVQALANLRYDLTSGAPGGWVPYVTAGAGRVFVSAEHAADDDALAFQAGVGATRDLGGPLGLRLDGRVLRFDDLGAAGATTHFQLTAGLVLRP
jgi:hypothetical protein